MNSIARRSGVDGIPPPPVTWSPAPQERRDFYHRVRVFPPDVAAWRKQMVSHVLANPGRFPRIATRLAEADVRALVDDGISYLREIDRVLTVLHGTPRLGNKDDPVDELVYIILARKTREEAYQSTYVALKRAFHNWDALLDAPRSRVQRLVSSGGLAEKKTFTLYAALGKLRERFGSCTLEPTRAWADDELQSFLCSLPEIQRKSAYCIMMYSLGRKVFPVDAHTGRIIARLGPYRELGLCLDGLDHKKLQRVLADLVPPDLRYSLHVNLIAHGRVVCTALRPLCGDCELRNFCRTYRQSRVRAKTEALSEPTVVDLFCGAGGLSEGFERAGFRTVLAIDNDPMALRTYWLNHPGVPEDRVRCLDLRDVGKGDMRRLVNLGRRPPDVLIGAPPCQGFSSAGFRCKKALTGYRVTFDDRNFLYENMVAAALELRPRLFLMENVPGMKHARQARRSFMESAAQMLESRGGYRTAIWRLNAAAHGVPQDRIRYFLVAARDGLLPSRPQDEYQDLYRADFDIDALPPVTLDEAIFDLPPRHADDGDVVERWERNGVSHDTRYRRYVARHELARESVVLYNHTVRYHNDDDLRIYATLRQGEDSVHALQLHDLHSEMKYRADVFDDKYAKLRADRPCKTIVSHLAKDGNGYIHPHQPRSLSFREAARVQSFHDRYAFCGSPSDQWVQLGNAVPPVLARAIARSFLRTLHGERR